MNVLIFGIVFILIILFLPEGLIGLLKRFRRSKKVESIGTAQGQAIF